jgi:hypothetical protein
MPSGWSPGKVPSAAFTSARPAEDRSSVDGRPGAEYHLDPRRGISDPSSGHLAADRQQQTARTAAADHPEQQPRHDADRPQPRNDYQANIPWLLCIDRTMEP